MRRINSDSKAFALGTGRMRFPFSEIGRLEENHVGGTSEC